jgi:hypothetical protein
VAPQKPALPERVESSNRRHHQAEVLLGTKSLISVVAVAVRFECPLRDPLPVGVLEDATRDTASGLHPAADRQTVAGLLDAAQASCRSRRPRSSLAKAASSRRAIRSSRVMTGTSLDESLR